MLYYFFELLLLTVDHFRIRCFRPWFLFFLFVLYTFFFSLPPGCSIAKCPFRHPVLLLDFRMPSTSYFPVSAPPIGPPLSTEALVSTSSNMIFSYWRPLSPDQHFFLFPLLVFSVFRYSTHSQFLKFCLPSLPPYLAAAVELGFLYFPVPTPRGVGGGGGSM